MAERDEMITFSFNPWQFQTSEALWRDFVGGLYTAVERAFQSEVPGKTGRRVKSIAAQGAELASKVVSIWRKDVGEAAQAGLPFLKKYTTHGVGDLKALWDFLSGERILITVDDLDRTDARMVPEIFYALKEVMDLPSLSFVCAFDPAVVGQVLGKAHPGFGNGLRFLEKIIDYPRRLPIPSVAQLTNLAISEESLLKTHVSKADLEEIIKVLPRNPRAIRRFVRLVELLRPQVDRHYASELYWPAILAANVMKVNFPELAHDILGDAAFWQEIYGATVLADEDEKEDPKDGLVAKKLESLKEHMAGYSAADQAKLRECVDLLAGKLHAWRGVQPERIYYQFKLAESPDAVTWKEFDFFTGSLGKGASLLDTAIAWISKHQLNVEMPVGAIVDELLNSAIAKRAEHLEKAADELAGGPMNRLLSQALLLQRLIEALAFDFAPAGEPSPFQAKHLAALLQQFRTYFHWRRTSKLQQLRKVEEKTLRRLFKADLPSLEAWTDLLYDRHITERAGDDANGLWPNLVTSLKPPLRIRCAEWMIRQFANEPEFQKKILYHKERGYIYRGIMLDVSGPIWSADSPGLLGCLGTSRRNPVIHNNACALLLWLDALVQKNSVDAKEAGAVLADARIATALWNACMAAQLNPRTVGDSRFVRKRLEQTHGPLAVPAWWQRIADGLPPI